MPQNQTEAEPHHGNLAPEALPEQLRRQLHVAGHVDLRDVDQPRRADRLPLSPHLDAPRAHTDVGALFGHIERSSGTVARDKPAGHALGAVREQVRLVRQADADERAARAFGAVDERRGRFIEVGGSAQLLDISQGTGDQRFVEGYDTTLARLCVGDDSLVAAVALLTQKQSLHAELHELRSQAGPCRGGRPFFTSTGMTAPSAASKRSILAMSPRRSEATVTEVARRGGSAPSGPAQGDAPEQMEERGRCSRVRVRVVRLRADRLLCKTMSRAGGPRILLAGTGCCEALLVRHDGLRRDAERAVVQSNAR